MLNKIWHQQQQYNRKIFALNGGDNRDRWTEIYLLGMVSQVNEILREIKWKKHRVEDKKRAVPYNVLEELADVFKFIISIAQSWGFTADDLLRATYEKGEILDFKLQMEMHEPITGRNIVIMDLDGTLANYRESFLSWLQVKQGTSNLLYDRSFTLLLDEELEMTYPDYVALKEEFEESGGYRNLTIYPEILYMLNFLHTEGWYIIVTTARPAGRYQRIFKDTLHWLRSFNLPLDELYMMGDERVLLASKLLKAGNEVVIWDDDPTVLRRAARSGINVYARKHQYNIGIKDVTYVETYKEFDVHDYAKR